MGKEMSLERSLQASEFNCVLESHESKGNMKIQAKLDELMQNNGQQLKEFHNPRKRKKWAG